MNIIQKIIAYPAAIGFTVCVLILTYQLLTLYQHPNIHGIFETAKYIMPCIGGAALSLIALGIAIYIGEHD